MTIIMGSLIFIKRSIASRRVRFLGGIRITSKSLWLPEGPGDMLFFALGGGDVVEAEDAAVGEDNGAGIANVPTEGVSAEDDFMAPGFSVVVADFGAYTVGGTAEAVHNGDAPVGQLDESRGIAVAVLDVGEGDDAPGGFAGTEPSRRVRPMEVGLNVAKGKRGCLGTLVDDRLGVVITFVVYDDYLEVRGRIRLLNQGVQQFGHAHRTSVRGNDHGSVG